MASLQGLQLAGLEAPYGDEIALLLSRLPMSLIHSKKLKLDAGDLSLRTFNENFCRPASSF